MLGFGVAFALPFTIFALFPSLMNKLPKSGGWLNSIKVVLGFIMLAFSMKFLMTIDSVYSLGILSRDRLSGYMDSNFFTHGILPDGKDQILARQ